MKPKYLASALSLSFASILATIASVNAQETQKTKFLCGSWRDIPMTVAQTPRGNIPIVYWVSDWVNDPSSDLTPQRRFPEFSRGIRSRRTTIHHDRS